MSLLTCRFLVLFLISIFSSDVAAQETVRASYGSLGIQQIILPLGVRAGVFQENGLNVEPVYIAGKSVSALIAGDVKFGFMGGPPAVFARLDGFDVVIIAGLNSLGQILVSAPSIKKASDLIGKKVGISTFGTTSDYGARLGLKGIGLQAQKDVTLIQIGDTRARIGGILSGAIQAATLSSGEDDYVRKLEFHVLTDNAGVEFPGNTLVTTRSYLAANRDIVKKFVRGLVETIRFIKKEPEKTKRLLGNIYRQSDKVLIAKRYQMLFSTFPDYPYITRKAIQSFLDILREDGKLKKPWDPGTFMDMSLLQELEKELRR